MGTEDKEIEELSLELLENPTYSVIAYPAKDLPNQYVSLIYSKWLRSLRFGNPLFKNIQSDEFYTHYHSFLEKLLSKPDSIVRLAILTDDPDVVLGFSVSREDVLDYVHVHRHLRRTGIGGKLIPHGVTTFSHITNTAMLIWRGNDKYKDLRFNPFA